MFLGSSKACSRLFAIRPPLPLIQVRKMEATKRRSLPSLKVCCQPRVGGVKEEALSVPLVVEWSSYLGPWAVSGGSRGSVEAGTTKGTYSVRGCRFNSLSRQPPSAFFNHVGGLMLWSEEAVSSPRELGLLGSSCLAKRYAFVPSCYSNPRPWEHS